jgi:Lon-like protease
LATALVVVAVSAFAAFYTFPSVIIRPGSADSVGPRLAVSGVKDYPASGRVLWATVALVSQPRLLDMVDGWLRDDVDIEPKRQILGDASPEESRRQSVEEMDDSKQVARVVAARKLGYESAGGGVLVTFVEPKAPAFGILKQNDVVVRADGQSLCLLGDLRTVISSHRPGETVRLDVRTGNSPTRTVAIVTTGTSSGRAVIGVYAGSVKGSPCKIPFDVKIDTARIGGPSAGLAMTLALLDRLTAGELTGGVPVAVTGTIEADGSVGPVGGVKQKTHAVKAAGAKLFIVPVDEVTLARPVAGSMKVVGVKNLDEALQALRDLGGDPLPAAGGLAR